MTTAPIENKDTAKHTPGPWEFAKSSGSVWRQDEDREKGMPLAYVQMRGLDPDQKETFANARLIAAAPELLEALEHILSWNRELGLLIPPAHFRLAADAIAKARGES